MIESNTWDHFCRQQQVVNVRRNVDILGSGELNVLMNLSSGAQLRYKALWQSRPGDAGIAYDVMACPGQSSWRVSRHGEVIYDHSPVCNEDALIPMGRIRTGVTSPLCLLFFGDIPEVWGFPGGFPFPRSLSIADGRFYHFTSFGGDEMARAGGEGEYFEVIIDSHFCVAVYHARHARGQVDTVWKMLQVHENPPESQKTGTRPFYYRW
ncbi:MAG: hypothetical protein HLX46_06880 [Corynebacterium sp.]|uniref:hypothetical protein n=1 Tax=Corynebacterium sp. TaxID=1720 RepID=UPI00182F9B85|nr:hypothetical protein [Corynebacterium sp.]NWO16552.1 hypothetical protein [Corynebacterium sp.]